MEGDAMEGLAEHLGLSARKSLELLAKKHGIDKDSLLLNCTPITVCMFQAMEG